MERLNGISWMEYLAIIIFIQTLSACATSDAPKKRDKPIRPYSAPQEPQVDWNNPKSIAAKITKERDDFQKVTKYEGPNCSGNTDDHLFIRAWKFDSTGRTTYQIYVMDYYLGEWHYYRSAWDSNGTQLDTTVISRDVGSYRASKGCSYYEHIGLNITKEYLEANKTTGIRFKLVGKAGEAVFFIQPAYIDAILLAVSSP